MPIARSSRLALAAAALVLVALAIPSRASAQSAEAQAMFDAGKQLAEDGDYAGACEKFATSERLDPQSGTEINLGKCHEQLGQTASAWSWYQHAVASAKKTNDDERAAAAAKRVRALEGQLVHLMVKVPRESRVDGLIVKLNERELEHAEWNTDLPVDPDEYTITAKAPGKKPWSDTVTVKSKDRQIDIPRLERARTRKRRDDAEVPAPANGNRNLTLALAGSGLVVAATATGLALYSQSLENQADAVCPTTQCTDAHAVDQNHAARLDGWIANVGWALGAGALAGAGIAWYLGVPDGVTVAPAADGERVGLVVGGRF